MPADEVPNGGPAVVKSGSSPNITIRDVANRAGVALSSVSRVLNGHPAVSESLRQRVLSAVADLDYEPDFTASSLRRGSTMTIAFLVRDIASPLFADIVKAAEEELGPLGYSMMLMNSNGDPDREAAHIRMLTRRRVDGLILSLSSESHRDTVAALKLLKSPMVLIDRNIGDVEASSVTSDHFSGVADATKHLVKMGHRSIALITGPHEVLASRERLRGYKAGLRSSGQRFDESLVRMRSYTQEFAYEQVTDLHKSADPPTAFIAGGAMLTYGALRAIREAGLSIPDDVALVGCDSWRSPELFEPSLTVVDRDAAEIGRTAATLLIDSITNGTVASVKLPTNLVIGSTTGPLVEGRRRVGSGATA